MEIRHCDFVRGCTRRLIAPGADDLCRYRDCRLGTGIGAPEASVRHDALCPFCEPEGAVLVNELAFARYDKYPVTPGYLLIM